MPANDVSDLRDVVDAINRLCETMKTSYDDETYLDCTENETRSNDNTLLTYTPQYQYTESNVEMVSPEEVAVQKMETYSAERWSDSASQISLPGQMEDIETVTSDMEPALAQCEQMSEMYYTASSEVSLLSDLELPDKHNEEDHAADKEKDDRKECVMAGHVAAMRERFESMTRTNTPCPDLVRSMSPSLDVFRNITPSPDRLG